MIMGIHLCPCQPSHAAALPTSRLLISNSTSSPFLRWPLPGLKMQAAGTARLRLVSRCAADGQPCEPSPEEDPMAAKYRIFRDKKINYERAAARALRRYSTQDATEAELIITLFREEADKLEAYVRAIASNRCIFDKEGRRLALMLAFEVGMAISLSAMVTANARVRVIESSGISSDTVEQMIRTCVSTFLKIVEDTCHRNADRTSITTFIDALRGLAAISHILIQDALVAVNNVEDGSSNYSLEHDVEALNNELQRNMEELEMRFTVASDNEAYELLSSTLTKATDHVSLFVDRMTNLRKEELIHIQAHTKDKKHIDDKDHATDKHADDKERDCL